MLFQKLVEDFFKFTFKNGEPFGDSLSEEQDINFGGKDING